MTTSVHALRQSFWPAEGSSGVRDITLGELLREAAEAAPERLALVDAVADPALRRHWTYAEFLAETENAARALLSRFEQGDRIAIWAPNSAEWVILQQAIAMAGMIVVAINPAYRAHELEYVLTQSGAVGMFHIESYRGADLTSTITEVRQKAPHLRELIRFSEWDAFVASGDPATAMPSVKPTDPVQIQYTSGTTGFPKGALLHHKGIANEAAFVGERAGMTDGDICINAMPMYHIGGGAVTELSTIAWHGTYVVMPNFDPGLTLELFETYHGTHALMVPTMLIATLDHPDFASRDKSSIKTLMSGAAAVAEQLVHRVMEQFGCQFSILFGQTEMHGVVSQTRVTDSAADQAGTVGQPLPELEVKLVHPDTGEIVGIGEQGEICCRGYQNMLGYYEMPAATAETIDSDGWLHMGDIGTMDQRGFLRVTSRVKDMIIRGGINVYPREIEDLLFDHPDIAEVAIIGIPDPKWGEHVGAVVRLRDGRPAPDPELVRLWCKERISAHKVPSHWYFVDDFPMTPSGKIQKFVLRDLIAAGELVAVAVHKSASPM
ncbi:AMP-dependent synthetase [Frondihabitans sp. PAMC 28766]|uniref:AMP-binding protein n=1 Tax=Frondihabitans sp. PAMC 28766 TaxID=1795630 RepID=UPI00078B44D6|nr:AMP-binding protein [Frondihabitans sp. PAMC 28766]AMM21865.1 AMP-dependent synthetase [Frondihabitans sp. PAMC 28766]